MFKAVSGQSEFPKIEEEILRFWQDHKLFQKSVENRKGNQEFVFYDGPPFATGLPHYGHLLAGTIKDVVPRYQTMLGKHCVRTFGWDCHGLPVENEMEKELKLSSKKDIEAYGIDKFNESCRGIVLRYTNEWEQVVNRMGRWVDFRNGYRTMDRSYMESIWWVFRQLWDKGLIYEGCRIQPYCPRCATPLANFEANQGYQDVVDPAITIRFQSADQSNTYFLAWTTTPWTLPSNLALAVGPDVDYVKIKDGDEFYIMAEARVGAYYKKEKPEVVERYLGKELEGKSYLPLFDYFASEKERGAFRVLLADYVSTEDGTGIVHTAPGFGEDDNATGKRYGISEICPIDKECCFTASVADYAGRYVKDCDKDIIARLKQEGKLVHHGQIKHSYPHCWRCDSPLIYRAFPTWFVKIDGIKQRMLDANSGINWVPDHLRDGRFGKWLANARDWNIGRNRYWGTPLPIWRNEEGEMICIGSVQELEAKTGLKVSDLHKHFVDAIEIPSPTGKSPLKRVPEVLDCWFESGSMPYAQVHYPFERKDWFENNFPADFIAEGLDQTRGWFYTLVVLAAALFDRAPFKNVVVNGLILAEDGQKMSKRKKNYPDPLYIVNSYGADALRLFLLGSPVVRAEDLKFSEEGVKEVLRSVILPIWNSFHFFVTYANLDQWTPPDGGLTAPKNPANPLDRWILSSLADMVSEIRASMDAYQLQKAANRFEKFVEDLTNWYIRRSRRRFWKSQNDSDKNDAYHTLYYVLITFSKCAAPFIPFITEELYRSLRTEQMPESVHLCDFPEAEIWRRDEYLERQMDLTMRAVSLGRFIRTQRSLKVRQPLARGILVSLDPQARKMLQESADIIAEELNVKEIQVLSHEEDLVSFSAKANFKVMGARMGVKMKEAAAVIAKMTSSEISGVLNGVSFHLTLSDGTPVEITAADLNVSRQEKQGIAVATDNAITIALDTALNQDLIEEGYAREFISKVQNLRKDSQLQVSDLIQVKFAASQRVLDAVVRFHDYICTETLSAELISELAEKPVEGDATDLNGQYCSISLTIVNQ